MKENQSLTGILEGVTNPAESSHVTCDIDSFKSRFEYVTGMKPLLTKFNGRYYVQVYPVWSKKSKRPWRYVNAYIHDACDPVKTTIVRGGKSVNYGSQEINRLMEYICFIKKTLFNTNRQTIIHIDINNPTLYAQVEYVVKSNRYGTTKQRKSKRGDLLADGFANEN